MSIVVARQDGNEIAIMSDTKLTYPNHEIKSQKTNPSEGIIKTVILSPNQCISFAGVVEFAEAALKEVGYSGTDEQIIEILTHHHKQSNFETEFLYCTGSPPLIYQIKENEIGPVKNCYLGEKAAFEIFQAFMFGHQSRKIDAHANVQQTIQELNNSRESKIEIKDFFLSVSPSISSTILSKMMSAMDYVIEMGNVASVGGFKVCVFYNDKFEYKHYNNIYRGYFELKGTGAHVLGHGNASEGGYSINFFDGSLDYKTVALHIKQANIGIVYHRENAGLHRPTIFKGDEIDFADNVLSKFKVPVRLMTEDRANKYFNDGHRLFESNDFKNSALCFFKAYQAAKGKQRALMLFNLGIVQLKMNDRNGASLSFSQAINIDASIKSSIDKLFAPKGGL